MDQVEEIKSKIDIVEIIQEHVPLKRAGRNFKGNCPFHGEKTPSFMVNPELQIFKCFGCQEGGDVFTFLQKIEGLEFGEVLQNLAKRVGVTLISYKPSQAEELKEKLIKINTQAAEYYHYLLTEHKLGGPALEYVKSRQLSDEVIKKFKLGFAPDGWDYLLKYLTDKKKHMLQDLQRVGLVVDGKSYDRFRNRLMFPLNNHRGQTVGFAGRILPSDEVTKKSSNLGAKYINTPETEIYHKSQILYGLDVTRGDIKISKFAVIVEGEIDCIASWQAGVPNVVAIKGSALTEKQVELLKRVCETVVLALDVDVAGDAASRRGIEIAEKSGLTVKIARWSGGKDPGDLAISQPQQWKEAVNNAIPVYDFYLQSAVERHGLEAIGKKRIGQEILPIFNKIDDEIVKALYLKKLADTLGVSETNVMAQLAKTSNPTLQKSKPIEGKVESKSHREIVEEYTIGLALREGKYQDLAGIVQWIQTPFWKKVIDAIVRNPEIKDLPDELKSRVQDLFLDESDHDPKEWEKSIRRLEEMNIRETLEKPDVDQSTLVKLTQRLGELTRSL